MVIHRNQKLLQDSNLNCCGVLQQSLLVKLEEEIDAQIDEKVAFQQKSQRARKMIARMIRKTQTYLVDSEKLLKEKLLAVKSMNHEL